MPEKNATTVPSQTDRLLPLQQQIVSRFKQNWPGFFKAYQLFIGLTLAAAGADMLSTIYFMLSHGPDMEAHPAVRLVCYLLGPVIGPIIGKLCQLIAVFAVTVYWRKQAVFLFIPVIVLYSWAAWYNVWGCKLYYPRLLRLLEFLPV